MLLLNLITILILHVHCDTYAGTTFGPDYVNVGKFPGVAVELRYATPNNFMGVQLYKDLKDAYLHKVAAKKLEQASKNLQKIKSGWKLLIFDALRPRAIQFQMWEKVKGTPQEEYVANPKGGSIHNFGLALDLSLRDEKAKEVDMGTPYDSFQELAQPKLEERFLKSGQLTETQIANRKILRKVMTDAGFIQLSHEWWHYDALDGKEVRSQFKIVE